MGPSSGLQELAQTMKRKLYSTPTFSCMSLNVLAVVQVAELLYG